MDTIEFDRNKCAWDYYKRPHMGLNLYREWLGAEYAPFVLFDTGEVICPRVHWKKDQRHNYAQQGVKVFSTADADAPQLYYDTGERVLKAHLTDGGGQILLADEATGVVVGCGRNVTLNTHLRGSFTDYVEGLALKVPTYFQKYTVSVYWSGPGREPVGSRIKIVRPVKLTKEERQHITSMQEAARTWMIMSGEEKLRDWWRNSEETKKVRWDHIFQGYKSRDILDVASFKDMPDIMRYRLADGASVKASHERTVVEKLFLKQ